MRRRSPILRDAQGLGRKKQGNCQRNFNNCRCMNDIDKVEDKKTELIVRKEALEKEIVRLQAELDELTAK